jgi:zinc protease
MRTVFAAAGFLAAALRPAGAVEVVALDSRAPLVEIKVMVKAGSASDPKELEGLAALTGALVVDGGFGDPQKPVTKEMLAELTRPWGAEASPSVTVTKETTVFSFKAPREVLGRYLAEVLGPVLTTPVFDAKELERVRGEFLQALRSGLRLEQIENLGLVALDNYVHEGTAYAHPDLGTEKGLLRVDRYALTRFYRTHYRPDNIVVSVGSADKGVAKSLSASLAGIGKAEAGAFPAEDVAAPPPVSGRKAIIVALPNAISSGLHVGFPLSLLRKDRDFWPLYVANVWFGAHRDSFSHLYEVIREQRGYNYGDYSYIEHFEGRPENLFPPFNVPRRLQYFSIWVRPVAHAYLPHIVKAVTWELENFVRTGLSSEQCALAKKKAKVL